VAAHVLGLRLTLLVGALRGDRRHVARRIAGFVLLAGATGVACWALLTLRDADADVVLAITVLGGSALVLGFALAPLIGGATDQLDPRRFALVDVSPLPLAGVLAVAGLLSVPTAALLSLSITVAIVWADHGVPVIATVLGVILFVATCSLLARVSMALTSLALRERRSRELSGLFVLAILVVVVPVGVFFASLEWGGRVPSALEEAVEILAVTPLGAAAAYPGLVALASESLWLCSVVALGTIAVLALAWVLLVRALLTTTERPASNRERGGLGWFAVAPGTPGGGIAARSLVYWLRDRRYLVNIVIIPIAGLLTVVPLLIAGVSASTAALVPVPFIALFLGWLPHNDLAYDSTAVWMHIASGVRGISDRLGRLVPVLLIGLPTLAVAIPIAISQHGRWALLPAMVGVCGSLFLSGLGLSSISSALSPYAVSPPGESPFQQPQRTSSGGAIAQGVVMIGAIVLSVPAMWWAWLAIRGDIDAADLALWGGLGVGFGVLLFGLGVGSFVFERRGARIMEFAEST
jgi:ABC-2 type transport system permease protein